MEYSLITNGFALKLFIKVLNTAHTFFFPSHYSAWSWIGISFIIKTPLFIGDLCLNIEDEIEIPGFWSLWHGDSSSYTTPIDSLINGTGYNPDYRMPGYGVVYLVFRLFLREGHALNGVLLTQLFCAILAVYFLAKTSFLLTKRKNVFHLTFYGYAFLIYSSLFDTFILSESLTISVTIFFVYTLVRFYKTRKNKYLIYLGIFYTFIVFAKPVYLPLALLVGYVFLIILTREKQSFISMFKKALIFLIPFLIAESAWVTRNYKEHGKLVFLFNGYLYPFIENGLEEDVFTVILAQGESVCYWEENDAKVLWFYHNPDSLRKGIDPKEELPDYLYTKEYPRDSLIELAGLFYTHRHLRKDSADQSVLLPIKQRGVTLAKNYIDSFKNEKPYYYHIHSRLKLVKEFFEEPFGFFEWHYYSPFKKILVGIHFASYLLVLILGFFGFFYFFNQLFKWDIKAVVVLVVAYTFLIFPIILRYCENRYLAPAFPFILMLGTQFIDVVGRKFGWIKETFSQNSN